MKIFGRKYSKGPKQDSKILVMLHMSEGNLALV
jgi:hypothetical protein